MAEERGQDQGVEDAGEAPHQPESDAAEPERRSEDQTPRRTSDVPYEAQPGYIDRDGRWRDRLDRIVPSRFNYLKLERAVPGLLSQYRKRVPPEFLSDDVEEDGQPVRVVACPCGEAPRVPVGRSVECACERFYLAIGSGVCVANSPTQVETPVTT